ncbi:MAG: hypothetical protein LQ338_001598 [Usnochroma carphineum]|nr:MAG: hypothetical protein LQ338_001598 [Usnochroma carphineum]
MSAAVGPSGLRNRDHDVRKELPPVLKVGHEDLNPWTSDTSTSLQVAPSELTPRSSFESQRSGAFASQAQASSTSACQNSTNPYCRPRIPNHDSLPLQPTIYKNNTAEWADESGKVPGGPHAVSDDPHVSNFEHSVPPSNGISSQKPPFAEPWVDFKLSPEEEQAVFPSTETETLESEMQRPTEAWNNELRAEHDETRQSAPVRAMSYTQELQELQAQPFESPDEALQRPNANEGPLPSFPSEMGASTYHEKAPASVPTDPTEYPEMHLAQPPRTQRHEDVRPNQEAPSPIVAEGQQAAAKQQRNETYQIRHVNWFDASSAVNLRRSPIMVQNANGPCPLLALVNALVLSTPADTTTALIETLRVREQVSLGLLLDAVIDELMSGRRGDAAQNLPDVSELYAFLVNLHTGMNVNPCFVESAAAPTHLMDGPVVEPLDRSAELRKPGGFEDTPHMRLYSTFAVSLVHGWLPRKNHPVCAALRRSAETYEDAQSLLFAEEDLENKLQSQGLTIDEQRLLEDIATVKHFLTTSPTQLTDYGLDTITEALKPGAVAILFRNDHFSTLYKQPRSGRIFTLVTDMGYAGHDEVVWESLVDISGEGSEFFSGDFRPVGNNVANNRRSARPTSAGNNPGWTTVSGRGRARSSLSPGGGNSQGEPASVTNAFSQLSVTEARDPATHPNTEQEDHDLALALQLQEEEEDRQRQESTARRRREDELSRAYLDSASRSNRRGERPQPPPRGGGARRAPPRTQTGNQDAPPPTYDQAAKQPAYHPAAGNPQTSGTPSRPNVDTTGAQASRPTRQTSAYSQTNSAFANASRPGPAARRQQQEKEKDCIVM